MTVKLAFWSVAAAIVAAFAAAAAPKLGLIEHAPLGWRYALLGVIASPIAAVLMLFWSVAPKAKAVKVTEGERKLPKVTAESGRKRMTMRRPSKAIAAAKAPKELANPERGGGDPTAAEMATLLETLTVFIDAGGNRAEAARALNLTPPGVSDRLRRLYEIEPERVTRDAPDWVARNIKE